MDASFGDGRSILVEKGRHLAVERMEFVAAVVGAREVFLRVPFRGGNSDGCYVAARCSASLSCNVQ